MVRRATAQDVADLAGVSRSSVSLVLNGHGDGNISAAKQQAILEAARQLDYRPNAVALSLRSRRTMTIGVLTWPGVGGFTQTLLHTVWEQATAAGYLPILMDTANDRAHELRAVTLLLDRQVDAFVVVAPELVDYQPPEVLNDAPLILVNCTDPEARFNAVLPDERGAAETATQLLIDEGHVAIAVLTDDTPTRQARDRVDGVRAALVSAELPPPQVLRGEASAAEGYRLARTALEAAEAPTAVVCARERFAVGALLACGSLGLGVPEQVSLVGLDDGENIATGLVPRISTVRRPDRAMAEAAVRLILHGLGGLDDGVEPAPRQLSFRCPVDPGASIGRRTQPTGSASR